MKSTKFSPKSTKRSNSSIKKSFRTPQSGPPAIYMTSYIERTPQNSKDFKTIAKLRESQKDLQGELVELYRERQFQHRTYGAMIQNLRNQQERMCDEINGHHQQYMMYRDLSRQMNHIIAMLSMRVRNEMGEEYLLEDPEAYERDDEE